jgi:hypothetical protein
LGLKRPLDFHRLPPAHIAAALQKAIDLATNRSNRFDGGVCPGALQQIYKLAA